MDSTAIPPVSEARRQAQGLNNAMVQEQLRKVVQTINAAAARGALKTDFSQTLLDPIRNELERQGYKLNELSAPRDGTWTVISW